MFVFDLLVCVVIDVNGNFEFDCVCIESEIFFVFIGCVLVSYILDDVILIYGSILIGYWLGGFNFCGVDNVIFMLFEEENVIIYEVGYKVEWGNFRIDVVVYV